MSHEAEVEALVLQWGHGGEAVETCHCLSSFSQDSKLQWGHGGEAVETFSTGTGCGGEGSLQWGHGG